MITSTPGFMVSRLIPHSAILSSFLAIGQTRRARGDLLETRLLPAFARSYLSPQEIELGSQESRKGDHEHCWLHGFQIKIHHSEIRIPRSAIPNSSFVLSVHMSHLPVPPRYCKDDFVDQPQAT